MTCTGQASRRWPLGGAALIVALGLAACEAPLADVETDQAEAPMAAPGEELPTDPAAEVEPDSPEPQDAVTAPPPSVPDGAESVRPESETLFY